MRPTSQNHPPQPSTESFMMLRDWSLRVRELVPTTEAVVNSSSFLGQEGYRYGFQGQERDDEVKGVGNSYVFNYRFYNPRLGRWFSVDPLVKKFPFYSPYHFAGNKPIAAIDLEGLEDIYYMDSFNQKASGQEAVSLLNNIELGAEILETFQRTYAVDNDPGNQGFDIFVTGSSSPNNSTGGSTEPRALDLSGTMPDLEQEPNKTRKYSDAESSPYVPRTVSVKDKILEAREKQSGLYYDFFVDRLGKEVLMSDEIMISMANQRKVILVNINGEWRGGFYSEGMSRIGRIAYALGHEINSHAINVSRGINISQEEEHLKSSGLKSGALIENNNPDVPDTQLRNQINQKSSTE